MEGGDFGVMSLEIAEVKMIRVGFVMSRKPAVQKLNMIESAKIVLIGSA